VLCYRDAFGLDRLWDHRHKWRPLWTVSCPVRCFAHCARVVTLPKDSDRGVVTFKSWLAEGGH